MLIAENTTICLLVVKLYFLKPEKLCIGKNCAVRCSDLGNGKYLMTFLGILYSIPMVKKIG